MSDSTNSANPANGRANGASAAGTERQFGVRRLYIRDVSFESPNAPDIFMGNPGEPEIKLNLRTSHKDLGDGNTEVSLHVSAHALVKERTLFLVEVEQAGIFQVGGFTPEEHRAVIGVACPNTLFPYAREAVSALVQRGGFPPLVLQPIDFAMLYNQAGSQPAADDSETTRT